MVISTGFASDCFVFCVLSGFFVHTHIRCRQVNHWALPVCYLLFCLLCMLKISNHSVMEVLIIFPIAEIKKLRQRKVKSLVEWWCVFRIYTFNHYVMLPHTWLGLEKSAQLPHRGHSLFLLYGCALYFPVNFAHVVTPWAVYQPFKSRSADIGSFYKGVPKCGSHACFGMTWVLIKNTGHHARSSVS